MMANGMKVLLLLSLHIFLVSCAINRPVKDPWDGMRQSDGSVTWLEEYSFIPPPKPWSILDLSETDFSLAFFSSCAGGEPGFLPCEATIAYAGEPFGYSQDLQQRQKEFFKRFLWASRLIFEPPSLELTTMMDGREALIATTIGREATRGQRVKTKVVFVKRGERVEAFFMNQWRSQTNPFDPDQFEIFDRFVRNFKYIKPSFYETL